jgi:predicted nucleotide-binding protein
VAAPQDAGTGRRIAILCRLGDAAREAASGFVAQLGLQPVVAPARQQGDAYFIDALDGLRGADYAVVLLAAEDLSPNPRPALLLEIGFLLGALGRGRLCFLVAGKPEAVPELGALTRLTMDDAGVWRLLLAREMKQAGLEVDLNRAL